MARKKGSKDKQKRRSRLLNTGALGLLGAGIGAGIGEGGYRGTKTAARMRYERLGDALEDGTLKPTKNRLNRLAQLQINSTNLSMGRKGKRLRKGLVGGGLIAGALLTPTIINSLRNNNRDTEGKSLLTIDSERISQGRSAISRINRTSQEARGWISLGTRGIRLLSGG